VRRVLRGGTPAWVFHNPATGTYWQTTPGLHRLAARFDGRITVAEALAAEAAADPAAAAEARATLLSGLGGMIGAGLLRVPGARPPPPQAAGWIAPLRGFAFTRVPLGDLGRALPLARPLLGWLFTLPGALVLGVLLLGAAWLWAGRQAEIAAQLARLADLDLQDAALGYLIFVATKLAHETGHAVAAQRMAAAEGRRVEVVPWGVSFMFLLPAPYVDASSAWFLASARRRAVVGLAGVATDLLLAALAALAWASVGPGALADRLFDVVLICGLSSLVFNLNPLMRLDGYYVASDLLGIENLGARGQQALGRVALHPLGLADRPQRGDGLGALWAAASWAYRWTVLVGIAWIAGGIHWLAAAAVAAAALILFLALPAWRGGRALLRRLGALPPGRAALSAAALLGLSALGAAALLLPVPSHVVAAGVVVRDGVVPIYPRADALVLDSAPAGTEGGTALRLDNPDTRRRLTQLGAEAEALAIEARRARATATGIDAVAEREHAVASQIAALREEAAAWRLDLPAGVRWEPLRAQALEQGWVRRDDDRPLGILVRADPGADILLVLDQWDGPAALAALAAAPDRPVPMRLRGTAGPAAFAARPLAPAVEARDALPSPALAAFAGGPIPAQQDARGAARPLERVFELRLRPLDPAPALPHGARVEARIALPPASLAAQLWWRLRQAVQRRLAV
jgi:putative peptide zinc metalloprotease protein